MAPKEYKDPDTETGIPNKLKKWKLWAGLATSVAVLTPFCVAGIKNSLDVWNCPAVQRVHNSQIDTLEKNDQTRQAEYENMRVQIANLTEQLEEVKQLCTETRQDVRSLRYTEQLPSYSPKEKEQQKP